MAGVTVVVPAYNEAGRIGSTVRELVGDYDVLVVDDGSTDGTSTEAREAGATVVEQGVNGGYIAALKRGFVEAESEVLVTYDADGEHEPAHVSKVATPVLEDEFDLVLGARSEIPRPSERFLNRLAQLEVDVSDSGSGLRAIRRSLATSLSLDTACTCGTFVLEAAARGARIGEVPIETRSIQKPRGVAWKHGRQFLHVLRYLFRAKTTRGTRL
jgi:glycosyltransferase involved in cell wall biosynthesis